MTPEIISCQAPKEMSDGEYIIEEILLSRQFLEHTSGRLLPEGHAAVKMSGAILVPSPWPLIRYFDSLARAEIKMAEDKTLALDTTQCFVIIASPLGKMAAAPASRLISCHLTLAASASLPPDVRRQRQQRSPAEHF